MNVGLCNQHELTKEQIDAIEDSANKFGSNYFGEGEVRYQRNISDNGLLLCNVDDMMQSIPKEIWDDVAAIVKTDLKTEIETSKQVFGELTKKPEEERMEYKKLEKK
jgi:hypothetical protein